MDQGQWASTWCHRVTLATGDYHDDANDTTNIGPVCVAALGSVCNASTMPTMETHWSSSTKNAEVAILNRKQIWLVEDSLEHG